MPQFVTIKKCYGFTWQRVRISWVAAVAALFMCVAGGQLETVSAADAKRVVVLDPGHGGNDSGVAGLQGIAEKRLSLELAKRLEELLGQSCKVVLTRTGDYDMPIVQRASIANHRKADVFVSLHAGGGRSRSQNRWTIYYYQPAPVADNSGNDLDPAQEGGLMWRRAQLRHTSDSRLLGEILQKRLKQVVESGMVDFQGAPLAVLQGAAMPAVLIELGYLTHPGEAEKLSKSAYREKIAESMARGILDFFKARSFAN